MIRIDTLNSYKYPNYNKENAKINSVSQQILVKNKNSEKKLSFKSVFLKNVNKKNILSTYRTALITMFSYIGIKIKDTDVKEQDSISKKKALLKHLKAQRYISSVDNKTKKPLYSKKALEIIDEYYNDENPFYTQNLTESLQYSMKETDKDVFRYIAETVKYHPARVNFYKNLNKYPYEYVKYLKAADIDEILTQKIATTETNFVYYPRYSPQDTLDLVSAAKDIGVEHINKFVLEKRIFLDKDNIINLASKNKNFSEQIDELISFVDEEDIANKLHVNFVAEILPLYVQFPDSIKDLLKLKIYDARKIKASINGYNQAPEAFKILLENEKKQNFINEIDFTELSNYSIKIEKYKKEIQDTKEENFKESSIEDLKSLIDTIERNTTKELL